METVIGENRRKYARFSDRVLSGTLVNLQPCAPFFGDTITGRLIDLSEGGMAILSSDLIPKKVFLKMRMKLPDGFEMDSVITVRHIAKQNHHRDFVHGVEFLNPSPDMVERIQLMAKEILACNERTQKMASSVCVSGCTLNKICKRPQRVIENNGASQDVIEFQPTVDKPTAAEIEDFFREAA